MITLKEYFGDVENPGESTLVKVSDQLWALGTLEEIREKVSPELFTLHIGMNMIGNWKGEGWWGIISEQPEMVPFIPDVLAAFGLTDMKAAFEGIVSCFPENTVFVNDGAYCDTVNFLQNVRFKVSDKRLAAVPLDKRKEIAAKVESYLDELEQLTEPLWGYSGECGGWKTVIDFISAHRS